MQQMIVDNYRDRESEEFLAALKADFIKAGMEHHACISDRWQHHAVGVERILNHLTILEKYLGRPPKEIRVLDLGCASGAASLAFALRGYGQVVGLDPVMAPLGLRLAKARAAGRNMTIDLTQGDGCQLPYQSAHFDFCFCDWVIEHVPAQRRLITEIHRVLAPGGVLYAATNNRLWPREAHSGLWFVSWLPHHWAGRVAALFNRCSDAMSWDVWLLTYWQLTKLVRRSGFEVVATHQDIFCGNRRWSASLLHVIRYLGLSEDAFMPNLYLVARKLLE